MPLTQSPFAEITELEYSLTAADLKTNGWQKALAASRARQDAMAGLITSSLATNIACKAGCWYCCHLKVEVRAEEALQIVEYARANFSEERQQRLRKDVADNAATLRGMSPEQQLSANLPCALLEDGKCSVYAIRPARCRTLHATDVTGCRKGWEEPANLNIPHTLVPELLYTAEAHLKGLRQAFADAGHDSRVYEMNAALSTMLD